MFSISVCTLKYNLLNYLSHQVKWHFHKGYQGNWGYFDKIVRAATLLPLLLSKQRWTTKYPSNLILVNLSFRYTSLPDILGTQNFHNLSTKLSITRNWYIWKIWITFELGFSIWFQPRRKEKITIDESWEEEEEEEEEEEFHEIYRWNKDRNDWTITDWERRRKATFRLEISMSIDSVFT